MLTKTYRNGLAYDYMRSHVPSECIHSKRNDMCGSASLKSRSAMPDYWIEDYSGIPQISEATAAAMSHYENGLDTEQADKEIAESIAAIRRNLGLPDTEKLDLS